MSSSPSLRCSNLNRPMIYQQLKQNIANATIAIDLSTLVTYSAFSHVASENDSTITNMNTQFVNTRTIIRYTGESIGNGDFRLIYDINHTSKANKNLGFVGIFNRTFKMTNSPITF